MKRWWPPKMAEVSLCPWPNFKLHNENVKIWEGVRLIAPTCVRSIGKNLSMMKITSMSEMEISKKGMRKFQRPRRHCRDFSSSFGSTGYSWRTRVTEVKIGIADYAGHSPLDLSKRDIRSSQRRQCADYSVLHSRYMEWTSWTESSKYMVTERALKGKSIEPTSGSGIYDQLQNTEFIMVKYQIHYPQAQEPSQFRISWGSVEIQQINQNIADLYV